MLLNGDGIDRTGRIVRGYGHNRHLVINTQFLHQLSLEHATTCPRLDNLTKEMLRQTQLFNQRIIPASCADVEQFRGRGNAVLHVSHTGEEVAEEVGHEEQLVSHLQLRVLLQLHGVELKQRIDGHHLCTTFGIVGLGIVRGKEAFGQTVGAMVTVADGITQQTSMTVDKTKIHAPGVDTDTTNTISLLHGHADAALHILKQGEEVPIDASAKLYLAVGKPADCVELQPSGLLEAGNDSATAASEVYSQKCLSHFVFLPKM